MAWYRIEIPTDHKPLQFDIDVEIIAHFCYFRGMIENPEQNRPIFDIEMIKFLEKFLPQHIKEIKE